MNSLRIQGLPRADNGRLLVRLNDKYRAGIPRYGIAKLTNSDNGKSEIVLVLGHDNENAIFMPYDIRKALGVGRDSTLNFTIHKVTPWRKLCWYVISPDPAVHVPAWIAMGSLILAVASTIIGIISIWQT